MDKCATYYDFEQAVQRGEQPSLIPGVLDQLALEHGSMHIPLDQHDPTEMAGAVLVARLDDEEIVRLASSIFECASAVLYTVPCGEATGQAGDRYELWLRRRYD